MKDKLLNKLLVGSGSFFLMIGIIGIFIPILPTTPFLLLAAACYARGSEKFYDWLMNNKWLGVYIKNYREGKGIPLTVKLFTLILLWSTIAFSAFIIIPQFIVQIILFIIALTVSIHILTIKTMKIKVNTTRN